MLSDCGQKRCEKCNKCGNRRVRIAELKRDVKYYAKRLATCTTEQSARALLEKIARAKQDIKTLTENP